MHNTISSFACGQCISPKNFKFGIYENRRSLLVESQLTTDLMDWTLEILIYCIIFMVWAVVVCAECDASETKRSNTVARSNYFKYDAWNLYVIMTTTSLYASLILKTLSVPNSQFNHNFLFVWAKFQNKPKKIGRQMNAHVYVNDMKYASDAKIPNKRRLQNFWSY